MRNATKFIEDAQKIQREYYLGKIQHETALAMLDELMRHHHIISGDEILVDIPDSFRRTDVYEADCEFVGEFTVRHEGSPYTWKRSFARNMPRGFPACRTQPSPRRTTFVAPPVLSEEERKFFVLYETQVAEEIVKGGRRQSAQIGDVEL